MIGSICSVGSKGTLVRFFPILFLTSSPLPRAFRALRRGLESAKTGVCYSVFKDRGCETLRQSTRQLRHVKRKDDASSLFGRPGRATCQRPRSMQRLRRCSEKCRGLYAESPDGSTTFSRHFDLFQKAVWFPSVAGRAGVRLPHRMASRRSQRSNSLGLSTAVLLSFVMRGGPGRIQIQPRIEADL